MKPDAGAAERQDVFDRWIAGLGLPIRQDVQRLALTSFVETARTSLVLLESPEPIDFTEDVTLNLALLQDQPLPHIVSPSDRVAARSGVPLARIRGSAAGRAPVRNVGSLSELARHRAAPIILSVAAIERGYRVELDAVALAAVRGFRDAIVIAERTARGITFYIGRPAALPRGRKRIFVDVMQDSFLPSADPTPPIPVLRQLTRLEIGTFALLSSDLLEVVDVFMPPQPEPPVALTVIQDGTGLRALLIPHQGPVHQPLETGTYELKFAIDRKRWPTEAASDDFVSRYRSSVTLIIKV
jgi:hypothetical protein